MPAAVAAKKILMWHVHGSYSTALLQGPHTYYLPTLASRSPDGLGRARTWNWPPNAVEIDRDLARTMDFDLVIVQRLAELETLVEAWSGRRPGVTLPVIYLEHNAPDGSVSGMRHPVADRSDVTVVHVTHFNDVFWDTGSTATRVIEHGIVDPGYRYTGDLERAAVAVNEPIRRGRVTGTDLLERFERSMPIDLFGMGTKALGGVDDPPQALLHQLMPMRRAYVHPIRWTSLGLTLLEAMHLGMPVVALAATDVVEAVPSGCGVVSTNVERLCAALEHYKRDREAARQDGLRARSYALSRYGLDRFLADWDAVITEVAG